MEAQDFAAGAYFTLFLVLAFYIALSAILIYFINKELKKITETGRRRFCLLPGCPSRAGR